MTTHSPSGWLSIRQAAAQLEVSELTVRRRIKDGKLAHRLEGGKYFVNLDLPMERSVVPAAHDRNADAVLVDVAQVSETDAVAPTLALDALLPELSRLAQQAGRADALQDRVSSLEEQCDALRGEVVALSGRNGWLESQVQERENAVKQLADSQHKRRWRRLFG